MNLNIFNSRKKLEALADALNAVHEEELERLDAIHIDTLHRLELVYKDQVDYLKKTVERMVRERENERAEYKRTVDALLVILKAPAIGQGSDENRKPLNMSEVLGFMSEEVKVDPTTNAPLAEEIK